MSIEGSEGGVLHAPATGGAPPLDDLARGYLAAIIGSSEDAIIGKTLETIITTWNPGAERLYGYAAHEAIGRSIAILVPPERPDELPSIMARLRRGERIQHYETVRVRKDGVRLDVSVSISPIKDANGRIIGAASIARDITERRRAEQERAELYARERAGREQLDAILGGVADGVLVQGEDGRFVYANDAAARMAGFATAEEYLGADTFELSRRLTVLDADGRPFPYEQLPARRALRGEPFAQMVVRFTRSDTGEVRWSRTQARSIHGPHGERLAISIFHDITDEARSGQRLRFLADAGASLAGSLEVGDTLAAVTRVGSSTLADWAIAVLVGEDGQIERTALAHRDPARDGLLRELSARYPPRLDDGSVLGRVIAQAETVLIPKVTEAMLDGAIRDPEQRRLVGHLGIVSTIYVPLVARGRTLGALGLYAANPLRHFDGEDLAVAEEIARRAALALDNARLYRQARDAVAARDEFLSIASHELRTPVTAISGLAQLLQRAHQRGTLEQARLGRSLEQIQRASARLAALTEDLLDVSRLQTGHFALRPETLDVLDFVSDLVERYREHLSERHSLALRVDGAPGAVHTDPSRLEQVVANLLSNAVKYSPDGGAITVTLAREGAGIRLDVRDPGIGLPPGAEERIFRPFGRAPNAAEWQIQGLGLGLYICRQIVERHGGRIWAESPGEGQGTLMRVWLPCAGEDAGDAEGRADDGAGVPSAGTSGDGQAHAGEATPGA